MFKDLILVNRWEDHFEKVLRKDKREWTLSKEDVKVDISKIMKNKYLR